MPFTLSRSGPGNVPAEVQRWQYFLRRQRIPQIGNIDGQFGIKTEGATKIFQLGAGVAVSGKVDVRTLEKASEHGYTIVPDDHYELRAGTDFPPRPSDISSPSNATRNRDFTCFKFLQRPLSQRPDAEAIVIKGSCNGQHPDRENDHVIEFDMPQLTFARGYNGSFRCHVKAAPLFRALFQKWEQDDLLHLIGSFEGCFVPRYKRNQAPAGRSGHGEKKSSDVDALSNHSFGLAFDINFIDNMLGTEPAVCGHRGSVRELVSAANSLGIFWGAISATARMACISRSVGCRRAAEIYRPSRLATRSTWKTLDAGDPPRALGFMGAIMASDRRPVYGLWVRGFDVVGLLRRDRPTMAPRRTARSCSVPC